MVAQVVSDVEGGACYAINQEFMECMTAQAAATARAAEKARQKQQAAQHE